MIDFNEYKSDEIRDWLNADITKAYIAKLQQTCRNFQQDALGRARAGDSASYHVGKADGIDDALNIARGPK